MDRGERRDQIENGPSECWSGGPATRKLDELLRRILCIEDSRESTYQRLNAVEN